LINRVSSQILHGIEAIGTATGAPFAGGRAFDSSTSIMNSRYTTLFETFVEMQTTISAREAHFSFHFLSVSVAQHATACAPKKMFPIPGAGF
jgi:hypothetical protein